MGQQQFGLDQTGQGQHSQEAGREAGRPALLRRPDGAGSPPDPLLDRLTAMAARRMRAPGAFIGLVDGGSVWLASCHGLDLEEAERLDGLCGSVIEDGESRAGAAPNGGEAGILLYAGVPLRTQDGVTLGALCVLDRVPRPAPDPDQTQDLQDLAAVVMVHLDHRLDGQRQAAEARMAGREVDHRVMNSLQFISAMLAIQARATSSREATEQLEAAASRVSAVARVHRSLYVDELGPTAGCLAYLHRLCSDLADVLHIPIELDGTEAPVPSKQLQPIGLLVNELVTSAAKHGSGTVQVTFGPAQDGMLALQVVDSGPGLPPDFDQSGPSRGLGMRLVTALARQLRGRVETGCNPAGQGACFSIVFPDALKEM